MDFFSLKLHIIRVCEAITYVSSVFLKEPQKIFCKFLKQQPAGFGRFVSCTHPKETHPI